MNTSPEPTTTPAVARPTLTPTRAGEILWECAWEALVLAFLVQLFGGLAFGMVSSLWQEMTPDRPPGFTESTASSDSAPAFFHLSGRERFLLIYGVVFIGMALGQFARYSRHEGSRRTIAWFKRLNRRTAGDWFQLIVVNAIVATITVSVLRFTSQFTWSQFLWTALGDVVRPVVQWFFHLLPAGPLGTFQEFSDWFSANQFKFSFWLLYSAAICDDLGLPNYKALGRAGWHWLTRRRTPVELAPKPTNEPPV